MDFISLSKTALFRGTTPQETEKMLSCLGAEQRHFSKGEMICRTGDIVTALGMVLTACTHHNRLIRNLLSISAQKNLNLSRKIFHTASKSIRGRLSSYLSYQAIRSGSHSFTIPFNRQQLADYLNVDRSALSNELSKMQKEGLLKVDKSRFELMYDSHGFGS